MLPRLPSTPFCDASIRLTPEFATSPLPGQTTQCHLGLRANYFPACLLRSTSLWAGASAISPLHLDKRLLTALTLRNELKMASFKTPPDAPLILQWRCFNANKKLVGQGRCSMYLFSAVRALEERGAACKYLH